MTIPNRGPQLRAVDFTFAALALTALALRCYTRGVIIKAFGRDDWAMCAAAVTFLLYSCFSITGTFYGTGRHQNDVSAQDHSKAKIFWFACYLTYCLTMILSKVSIAWFLLRVTVRRVHKLIIYVAALVTVVSCFAFFLVIIFQCRPVSYFWDTAPPRRGSCVDPTLIQALAYLYSVCSVLTDLTFALLPAWIVSQLNMKTRTKVALIPLMTMGCIASSAVVVRMAFLHKLADPDFLWATVDVAIWSTVEEGLAVTAGSLAALHPLLRVMLKRFGVLASAPQPSGAGGAAAAGDSRGGSGAILHHLKPCGKIEAIEGHYNGGGSGDGSSSTRSGGRIMGVETTTEAVGISSISMRTLRVRGGGGRWARDAPHSSETSFEGVRVEEVITVVRDGPVAHEHAERGCSRRVGAGAVTPTSNPKSWTETISVLTRRSDNEASVGSANLTRGMTTEPEPEPVDTAESGPKVRPKRFLDIDSQ